MSPDASSSSHDAIVVGRDYALTCHHQILLSYFPAKVSVEALRAVHAAHMTLRTKHPEGTVTLAIVASGIAMPERDVRIVAAQIGREASVGLLGEGLVLQGHAFWVAMARSTLRAIQIVSHSFHSRSYFSAVPEAAGWALERSGRSQSEHAELVRTLDALVAAVDRAAPR